MFHINIMLNSTTIVYKKYIHNMVWRREAKADFFLDQTVDLCSLSETVVSDDYTK